jgi:hypothetical protein
MARQSSDPDDRISFDSMWSLIQDNHTKHTDVLTPELLVAIFWEETFFANILQIPNGPAVGFGQVQPNDSFPRVLQDFGKTFTVQGILDDDDQSVEVASLTLASLFQRLHRSKEGAIHGYAGTFSKDKDPNLSDEEKAKFKTDRIHLVNGWLSCERQLRALSLGPDPDLDDDDLVAKIQVALKASRLAMPSDFDVAFP